MKLGKLIAMDYLRKNKTVTQINKLKPFFTKPKKESKKEYENMKKYASK